MTDKKKRRKYCGGCRNDFYNGNNSMGVLQCWHLTAAKAVRKKEVHIDQRPPWKQKAKWFLDCYSAKRYVYVNAICER